MTIDERLEALTMNLELAHREIQDLQRLAEETGENIRALEERQVYGEERHDREMASIRAELRRAVLLSIREARAERGKRQTLDQKVTQLAAAQIVTEEKLQRFLESRQHGNGKP
jgi:hypothetical protein